MHAHTAGYVDTHHKNWAVHPCSQTDKVDTGRGLSADKFSPVTFSFLCLALYILPLEFYLGAAVAEFAHPSSGTGRGLAHTAFVLSWGMGFLMKCPTILGPDGGVLWVYPQQTNPRPGPGAGLCASGSRKRESEGAEWKRCEVRGRGIEPE